MQRFVERLIEFSVLALGACPVAASANPASAGQAVGWQPGLTVAPYLWLASLDGSKSANTGGGNDGDIGVPPRLDVSTDHEWNTIGLMLYGEWRGERWTAFFDYVWADVQQDANVGLDKQLARSSAEVGFDAHIYQAGLGYRVLGGERSFVTVYGGGRLYDIDSKISAKGGVLPGKIAATKNLNWQDAVLGARWFHDFGGQWTSFVVADYGFGDSESVWQVYGNLGREFSWGRVMAGYRYMNLEYETNNYHVDVALKGPVLGFALVF